MQRSSIRLNIILVVLPLFVLSALNFCNPSKPTVSELENRNLKVKPPFELQTLFSGQYFRDYEEHFADTFVFRESLVRLSKKAESLWGITRHSVALVDQRGANVGEEQVSHEPIEAAEESEPSAGDAVPDDSSAEAPPPAQAGVGSMVGRLLIYEGKAMEVHTFSEENCIYYAEFINSFAERMNDGVTVYSLLAPTQIEFLNNERYKSLSASQQRTISTVNTHLNPQIVKIDAYNTMRRHSDEYLFFGSDHHWTALGAYYAYTAFIEARGDKAVELEVYEVDEVTPYLGSLYSSSLHESIKNNPDTIYLYKPFVEHEYRVYYEGSIKMPVLDMNRVQSNNKYNIFMSGDRPWGRIVTEVKNGKKIVVIKDSYGNAFVPFLIPHYEEVYIVDPRQFQLNITTFIEERGIQEVLFLNYAKITEYGGFTDLLHKMVNK